MRAIALLSKYPKAGEVKSRLKLAPHLTAKIYQAFLRDIETTLIESQSTTQADIFCFFDGKEQTDDFQLNKNIQIKAQRGEGLGEKIINVISDLKDLGYEQIIIIGGDTLDIKEQDYQIAFTNLENEPKQVILGPTKDGGIYLLAHNSLNSSSYLKNVKWGSDKVYKELEKNISETDLMLIELKEKTDIDTIEDLYYTVKKINNKSLTASHTKLALEECFFNDCCIS